MGRVKQSVCEEGFVAGEEVDPCQEIPLLLGIGRVHE